MERPTKPVMWTDKEAIDRLFDDSDEFNIVYCRKEFIKYWDNITGGYLLSLNKDDPDYEFGLNRAIDWLSHKKGITSNSLLHDLNIIKPTGRLEYASEWIDKILSGQKTMSIRKTQYMCGYYELWDTERQEVRGGVDVTQVQKILFEDNNILGLLSMRSFPYIQMSKNTYKFCGFDSREAFADHHRTHFQSVKYAITYRIVDMKGDME